MFDFFNKKDSTNKKDLFSKILENNIPYEAWICNLSVPVTEKTTSLLNNFLRNSEKSCVEIFFNTQKKAHWYNIPFQYTPYWDSFKYGNRFNRV